MPTPSTLGLTMIELALGKQESVRRNQRWSQGDDLRLVEELSQVLTPDLARVAVCAAAHGCVSHLIDING